MPSLRQFAGGDALGSDPVRLSDVALDVGCSNAPDVPASDLNTPQIAGFEQRSALVY